MLSSWMDNFNYITLFTNKLSNLQKIRPWCTSGICSVVIHHRKHAREMRDLIKQSMGEFMPFERILVYHNMHSSSLLFQFCAVLCGDVLARYYCTSRVDKSITFCLQKMSHSFPLKMWEKPLKSRMTSRNVSPQFMYNIYYVSYLTNNLRRYSVDAISTISETDRMLPSGACSDHNDGFTNQDCDRCSVQPAA